MILEFPQAPDVQSMDAPALTAYLEQLRDKIAALDAAEPKNMNSDAYEEWGEEHEALEDLVDELLDRLDELAKRNILEQNRWNTQVSHRFSQFFIGSTSHTVKIFSCTRNRTFHPAKAMPYTRSGSFW